MSLAATHTMQRFTNEDMTALRARKFLGLEQPERYPNALSLKIAYLWRTDAFAADVPFVGSMLIPMGNAVDFGVLRDSLSLVFERHETLRCRLSLNEGRPVLVATSNKAPVLPVIRVKGARLATLREWGDQSLFKEFLDPKIDLFRDCGPQSCLFMDEENNCTLAAVAHHYFGDGWSQQIIRKELTTCYDALARGHTPALEAATQFTDYALRQRKSLSTTLNTHLARWREWVSNIPTSQLPYDRSGDTGQMGRILFGLADESVARLGELARAQRASRAMVFLAALQITLAHWSNQNQVVTAVSCADRIRPEFKNTVGYLQSGVPVLSELDDKLSLSDFLTSLGKTFYSAYAYRDLSYELVEEIFDLPRPISTVLLNYVPRQDNLSPVSSRAVFQPPMANTVTPPAKRISLYRDIYMMLVELPHGMAAKVFYNMDRFDQSAIMGFIDRFKQVVAMIGSGPQETIGTYRNNYTKIA